MTSVNNEIVFSETKRSGNFEKITIRNENGKKVTTETENFFSWGVRKSDKYESYSLPLVFKNDSETLKKFKKILQKCYEHSPPETEFSKCLYEKTKTTTIYPKIKCYNGHFNTGFYENDVEISPNAYLDVKCDAGVLIHVEGILLGNKTSLLMNVPEVKVSEPKEVPARKRLLRRIWFSSCTPNLFPSFFNNNLTLIIIKSLKR